MMNIKNNFCLRIVLVVIAQSCVSPLFAGIFEQKSAAIEAIKRALKDNEINKENRLQEPPQDLLECLRKRSPVPLDELMEAVDKNDDLAIACYMRDRTIRKAAVDGDKCRGFRGFTILHFAAKRNNLELAQMIVEAGGPTDKDDSDAHTPLMIAAYEGAQDVFNYLLSKMKPSEIVKLQNMNAANLLHLVLSGYSDESASQRLPMIHTLLKYDFDMSAKLYPGFMNKFASMTALQIAEKRGVKDEEILKKLAHTQKDIKGI